MGFIRELLSVLWSILTSRWYWIIVTMACAIVMTPFLMIMLIINLPSPLNFISTILIVVAWGVAAGYKDWIIAKAKEEKQKIQQ
jgi:hypothetical protein